MIKKLSIIVLLATLTFSCIEDRSVKPESLELTYLLQRTGYEPVDGDVVFSEVEPGVIKVEITLENTDERYDFPAHLHFGTIKEVGQLAKRLNDVDGATGKSVTILDHETLTTNEVITLGLIDQINGSVKIHLTDEGIFKNKVLAFGNIGANENYFADGIAVCVGH